MARKRMKKDYEALYRNPLHLFPPSASSPGTKVTLWPNGEREIWISDPTGRHGVCITAGTGPYGLGLTIRHFVGATPLTVRVVDKDYRPVTTPSLDNVREVTITAYNADERAQAFKRWYDGERTPELIAILGPKYAR